MKFGPDFQDLEQDIRNHIEEEVAENLGRGMTPGDARSAALKKFGNILHAQEATRAIWVPGWLDEFFQDCRYAQRTFQRSKVFSAVVLLTMALGIGINTAVFSVVNTVLLRPLSYPDPERLVAYSAGISAAKAERFKPDVVGADFEEWRLQSKTFEKLAGYQYQDSTLASTSEAARVRVVTTAGDFWPLTGARPALGTLSNESNGTGTMILSHRAFSRQFGGDRNLVGKTAMLGGKPLTIVGVLPPEFRFLFPQERSGSDWREVDVFVPSPPLLRGERARVFVVGKLKLQISIAAALNELRGIQAVALGSNPDRWFGGVERMTLAPLQEQLAGTAGRAILVLQIAGIFVLLIACANVANLLLARTAARRREVSIRLALGAGRARLVRQFFSEGILVAALGAAGGLILAKILIVAMVFWGLKAIPRLAEVEMDGWVLGFTIGISLLSAMLFCLGPAATLWRKDLQSALMDRSGDGSGRRARLNLHKCLVAAELALSVVLLAGAGLMVKSFLVMHSSVPGFEPDRTLVFNVSVSGAQYREQPRLIAFARGIVDQIESLPGVQSAGIAEKQSYLLQRSDPAVPAFVDQFQESLVSPGYFAAMGMRLVAGRWLEANDLADAAVINETLAKRAFQNHDPLGQNILKLGRPVRVVGVVANLKYARLDAEPGPEVFRGYSQNLSGLPTLSVVARVRGNPLAIATAARSRIAAIDPQQAVHDVQTLADALADSVASRGFNLVLLASFAGAAFLMAIVGIYGVVAYSVSQRTVEIGLRMALGAKQWGIVGMLIRQAMLFTMAGILIGIAASLLLTRWIASMLYAVQPNDPETFSLVTGMLVLTALLACAIPAARAARIDPLLSLRHQ